MLRAQGRLTVSTNVDGVMENHEITIDSIFDVQQEETANTDAVIAQFDFDDFEKSIAELCVGNQTLANLVLQRRDAVKAGNDAEVDAVEAKILEAL